MLFRKLFHIITSPSIRNNSSYYITTPIFYVNSSPHIGHVYTVVLADAINRFQRLKSSNQGSTIFSTGTDEHGLKIQTAALAANKGLREFCDINANKFKNLFDTYKLSLTDFIRTTDPSHEVAVRSLWIQLFDSNLIYKRQYSGWYCTSDESFVPETQVEQKVLDHGQIVHVNQEGKEVRWSSEDNYIFKFSNFRENLIEWLKSEKPIIPERFNDEAISMLKKYEVDDLSISRPKQRIPWAIEVPNDHTHTVYVWLDALTNYLTVSGYPCDKDKLRRWPIDCQVFGKDILKFHAIIWPSLLLALKLPLPKKLICHSHWLVDDQKMSKSLNNSVDPITEAEFLTREGLRYYLLRAGTPHSDTNYSRHQAIQRINSELANTYGNLLARACSTKINPAQSIPLNLSDRPGPELMDLIQRLGECPEICAENYNEGNFYRGIDKILSVLRSANQIYEKSQPWNLVKQMGIEYHDVQATTFETLRICSILLQPVIPETASRVLDKLRVSKRSWQEGCKLRLNRGSQDVISTSLNLSDHQQGPIFARLKLSE